MSKTIGELTMGDCGKRITIRHADGDTVITGPLRRVEHDQQWVEVTTFADCEPRYEAAQKLTTLRIGRFELERADAGTEYEVVSA